MRILANIQNTDAPSSDYPKGRIRTKTVSQLGTPIIEAVYGDIVQFFQKLAAIAGIIENDLPDNETNGHQLIEALANTINRPEIMGYEYMLWEILNTQTYTLGGFGICTINETDIAIADNVGWVRAFTWNGAEFSQIGNDYVLSTPNVYDIQRIGDNKFVLLNNYELITLTWDGTDFSQVGNAYTLTGSPNLYKIIDILDDRIALVRFNDGTNTLETYEFDGTDWGVVGNTYTLGTPTSGRMGMTKLNDNEIALAGFGNVIQKYSFDGTDWSTVGNSVSTPSSSPSFTNLATLNPDEIVYTDNNENLLYTFRFDGTDWTKLLLVSEISSSFSDTRMTLLDTNKVLVSASNIDEIKTLLRYLPLK